ncbi:SACOL1771 family peroxiredoxin [Kroppenstedtia pulmonis]|uniref:SACOL1771 family peroxiredoxin n=1 Tax=Kroppenstedtia pulmonis TaxID=1380685 RepID=A0A7D4BES5_9BACL|nr:SACOL1771 family peroxiredoxin [Kroppenstedtia pulmonis]QKG83812.1 SACOL1771 family peroxiredoxin [Kroppenstedtia pulmonis]
MTRHTFHLQAEWTGGRNGKGRISAENLQTQVSVPREMDGPGVGTNPDEMLIGAAATCYMITLAAMIERRNIPLMDLKVDSEGVVSVEKGLKFESITHRPKVVLGSEVTEKQVEQVKRDTELAEQTCMISNALRGNVQLGVEATITIAE